MEQAEPRFHHGLHCVGQLPPPRCSVAHQLLEIKRVAVGARDQRGNPFLRDLVPEYRSGQLFGRTTGQATQVYNCTIMAGPDAGKTLLHFGPAECDDRQRLLDQLGHGRIEQLDRGAIAPVQIIENQDQRTGPGLGTKKVEARLPHLIAHELGISPRRAQLKVFSCGRNPQKLAEKNRYPVRVLGRNMLRNPSFQPTAPHPGGFALGNGTGAPDGLGDDAHRRSRAHRVAVGQPDLQVVVVPAETLLKLVTQPGLAESRRAGDQGEPCDTLFHTFLDGRIQRGQLAFAADKRRRSPEHRQGRIKWILVEQNPPPYLVASGLKAAFDQLVGDLVNADPRA